jgi:ACS family hexuronate transporter-like MFS transporter
MVGPPMFAAINESYGWRSCFLITASLGAIWMIFWLSVYRTPEQHSTVTPGELAYIRSDAADEAKAPKVSWSEAFGYRQTWGFGIAKFLTDPVWWFYLFWVPPYLFDVRHLDLKQIGWSLPVIYLMADFGSVGGGWLSGFFIRRGWPNGKARKAAMAICAAAMPVAALSVLAESPVLAIGLISIATAAHQGWSANLYTTVSDVFPKPATASVIGIGGCMGGFGGVLFSAVIPGYVVTYFGYKPMFLVLGAFHLTALLFVHKLLGDMRPLEVVRR